MRDALSPDEVAARLTACREQTLRLIESLGDAELTAWPDESFSPIGWHLAHVAFTEAQWILGRCAGRGELWEPHVRSWSQDGCPKSERVRQPEKEALLRYVTRVREEVLEVLPTLDFCGEDPLLARGFVGWFVEAHEHQHRETMALVRQAALELAHPEPPPPPCALGALRFAAQPGGTSLMGTDAPFAYDNERCEHEVRLDPFSLSTLATVADWDAFRAEGGYRRPELWSARGWGWREASGARWPRGWTRLDGLLARVRLDGVLHPLGPDEPVTGVSFHEAEAFARFHDARLPTEAEWELAARSSGGGCLGLVESGPLPERDDELRGNLWVWTSTAFSPYPGFRAFPYAGYSEPYFDGAHRVLRGGSFATDPSIARVTFRNWFLPSIRQIFAGVRLAR